MHETPIHKEMTFKECVEAEEILFGGLDVYMLSNGKIEQVGEEKWTEN